MNRVAALTLVIIAAGCAEDETAILMTICTNVSRERADTLRVEFDTAGGAHHEQPVGMADVGLPRGTFEVSLRPGQQFNGAFTINAVLLDGDTPLVERRITTGFMKGQNIEVKILLDVSCIEVFCEGEQTCDKGVCTPLGIGDDSCNAGSGEDGGVDCDRDTDQYQSLDCGGNDCDDDDSTVHPDAAEICDQLDNDCSGVADDGLWIAGPEAYASYATTDEQAPTIAAGPGMYGISWRATRHCQVNEDCDGLPCVDGECSVTELRFVSFDVDASTPPTDAQAVLSGPQPFSGEPALAWSGQNWGVVFEDESGGPLSIFFRRVDANGLALGEVEEVSYGQEGAYQPALAWSGSSWGAVWSEVVGTSSALTFGQIGSDGRVIGGSSLSPDGEDAFSGAIDWGDSAFGVAWISGTGVVWFQLASQQGVPDGAPVEVSDGAAFVGSVVDVSWAGDGWVLAWEQIADGVSQIFDARLDASGVIERAPEQIVQTGHRAVSPDLAWSGTELALVWADGNEGDTQVLLQRLSAAGEPQGAPTRMIRSETARGSRPSVSWSQDRFEFGVAWQDQRLAADTDVWFNRLYCEDGVEE